MSHRPIYFDTETTGLSAESDRIIEIAAYDPETDRSFVHFVNPGRPIPKDASAVHNITDEMVSKAPFFAKVAEQFVQFCSGDVVLVGHNSDSFDVPFLRSEFLRCGIDLPSWKFIDSLKWARRYRPDLPKHNLQFLRESYGLNPNKAHRALDDVIVLHQVFQLMIDDLSIDQAYEIMQRVAAQPPKELQHMPFGKYQGKPIAEVPRDYVAWLKKSGALDKEENKNLLAAFQKLNLV